MKKLRKSSLTGGTRGTLVLFRSYCSKGMTNLTDLHLGTWDEYPLSCVVLSGFCFPLDFQGNFKFK